MAYVGALMVASLWLWSLIAKKACYLDIEISTKQSRNLLCTLMLLIYRQEAIGAETSGQFVQIDIFFISIGKPKDAKNLLYASACSNVAFEYMIESLPNNKSSDCSI